MEYIYLALATASVSYTITKTPMFDWVRDLLPETGPLAGLMRCPYCMAHWVAAFFVLIVHPMPFSGTPLDLLPGMFVVVTLATFAVQLIMLLAEAIKLLKLLAE